MLHSWKPAKHELLGNAIPLALEWYDKGYDELQLILDTYNDVVWLWDTNAGRLLSDTIVYEQSRGPWPPTLKYSADGRRMAMGNGSTVELWDTTSAMKLAQIAQLKGHSTTVTMLEFSPDSKRLVSISGDDAVLLWDARDGRLIAALQGHTSRIQWIRFSANTKRLFSSSLDDSMNMWDTVSGRLMASFLAKSMLLSPSGRDLATWGMDQNIYLWDTNTGQLTAKLEGHSGVVTSVVFGPNEERLLSASGDGIVTVWSIGDPVELGHGTTRDWISRSHVELMTLIPFKNSNWMGDWTGSDWAVITPDGYVDASLGATKYISWKRGDKIYEFTKFKQCQIPGLWSIVWNGKPLPTDNHCHTEPDAL